MLKFTRLLTLLVCLSFLFGVKAETINNYLEKFDNLNVKADMEFAPNAWSRISDYTTDDDGILYTVTYENPATEGKDGAFLKTGTQDMLIYDYWADEVITVTLNDYLVTPPVGGEVSFWVKKCGSKYSTPNIKIFNCTRTGSKFTVGTLFKEIKDTEINADGTTWTKFTIPNVAAGTYYAFRMEYVGLDEFSATTAEIVRIPSMEIKNVKMISKTAPVTTPDNKFEVEMDVTIANTGNLDLTPGLENYSLTLYREEGSKKVDLYTLPIDQTVKQGAVSDPIKIKVSLDAGTKSDRLKYFVRENINQSTKYVNWIETKPFAPEMVLWQEGSKSEIASTYTFEYGMVKESVTKNFRIANTGFAPLNVTELVLPAGYTSTFKAPVTIEPQAEVLVPLTLSIEKAGTFNGIVKVVAEKVAAKEFNVSGVVIDPNAWYENFEGGKNPDNMLITGDWYVRTLPSMLKTPDNQYMMQNTSYNEARAISPLLKVSAGKAFNLRAARYTSYGALLKISYSADRVNWTLAKEIPTGDFSNKKVGSGYSAEYDFSMFTIDNIPEGNWYIAIEGEKVRVDDLLGYELVPVEHDLMINSVKFPSLGTVNHGLNAEINIKNLLKTETAGTYSIKLYLDGEVVAEADPVDFAAGDKNFMVAFTPHKSGKLPIYFEISAGDYVLKSQESVITISDEFPGDKIAMEPVNRGTGYVAPIHIGYELTETETIYSAEKLGLQAGTKIAALSYDGYCLKPEARTYNVTIYLQNTTDLKPNASAPVDLSTMTLVFQGDIEFTEKGSSSNPVEMIFAKLNVPFEYTGNNLRVFVHGEAAASSNGYFMVDKSLTDACIHRENGINLSNSSWYTTAMPLVNIFTEKEIPTLSGKVYSEAYGPLPNVKVKLISGGVLYSAYTNEQGLYSIPVIQSEKEYTLVIDEVVAYDRYEHADPISFLTGSQVLDICITPFSGVEGVEVANLVAYGAEGRIIVKANAAQMVNVYNIAGRLVRSVNVEEGTTTIESLMAGFYIVNDTKVVVR